MPKTGETKELIVRLLEELVNEARREGEAAAMEKLRSLLDGTRRGPGRPPNAAATPAAMPRKKRKNSWAGLSAEARLARVNAIRKGKGLPPRSS